MGYLQVRDFPEELHEELRLLAKKEHRNVSQQTIIAIKEHVNQAAGRAMSRQVIWNETPQKGKSDMNHVERRKKVLEKIHKTPKPLIDVTTEDIVWKIHEGRADLDARAGL